MPSHMPPKKPALLRVYESQHAATFILGTNTQDAQTENESEKKNR